MFVATKIKVRYVQVFLMWTGVIIGYVLRVNMSVGVVAMTSHKFATNATYPIYDWTEAQKSCILSSFFWGYILLQILFGNMAEKIGTKKILAVSIFVTSLLTISTPFIADSGYIVVIISRILQGLAQGALYPSVAVHISKWVPPVERTQSLSFSYSGSAFGPLVGFPLCGYLASSSIGWPLIFYVTGGLGLIWVVMWCWIGANSPKEYKNISTAELSYIEKAIQHDVKRANDSQTPWKEIFTSAPVYAMVVASIAQTWGYWTLLAEIPNYMSAVLNLDMKQNGLLSALPYLSAYIATILYSFIAAHVTKNYKISRTLHRNIWNSISLWGSSCTLLILSFTNNPSIFTAVLLLVMTVSLMTAAYNGLLTNHIDLSPNFCGTLVGITNSTGTLGPILGPLCAGWIITDPTSEEEWNIVFRLTCAIMFTGNLIYVMFSSSEIQSWNDLTTNKYPLSVKGDANYKDSETYHTKF